MVKCNVCGDQKSLELRETGKLSRAHSTLEPVAWRRDKLCEKLGRGRNTDNNHLEIISERKRKREGGTDID